MMKLNNMGTTILLNVWFKIPDKQLLNIFLPNNKTKMCSKNDVFPKKILKTIKSNKYSTDQCKLKESRVYL